MTLILTVSLYLSLLFLLITLVFLYLPVSHGELKLWRNLKLGAVRRWLTRRRGVDEPFNRVSTVEIARRNLRWHALFTGLFSYQLFWALIMEESWWRPLALPLVIFTAGLFVGSLVQRQKIAIVSNLVRKKGA